MTDKPNRTIAISSFHLPISTFLGRESRQALEWYANCWAELGAKWAEASPPIETATADEAIDIRQRQVALFYESDLYQRLLDRYPVGVQNETIDGVFCEVFIPKEGITPQHTDRVLINLHGGAFIYGSHINSRLESIPIAVTGNIKVISIDYRMAPGYRFPAATADVISVYKKLLEDYPPENIGIYGASAGAILTSQAIAQLQQENLPLPAAIGMFAAGAFFWKAGDSGHLGDALLGFPLPGLEEDKYFQGVAADNPQAFPGNAPEVLAKFPPSLLISSTRDFCLSAVLHTHTQLTKLGVPADLHVWEGLDHVFFWNPELPESHEAYDVIVRFFERHLGRKINSE